MTRCLMVGDDDDDDNDDDDNGSGGNCSDILFYTNIPPCLFIIVYERMRVNAASLFSIMITYRPTDRYTRAYDDTTIQWTTYSSSQAIM
jgi:hypothetical protein